MDSIQAVKTTLVKQVALQKGRRYLTLDDEFTQLSAKQMLLAPIFEMGLILYDGEETLPVGDKLWAAPISTLWGTSKF
jgi:hypothetical protein